MMKMNVRKVNLQRRQIGTLPYYQFDAWEGLAVRHALFTRHGGVSHAPWDSLNIGGTVGDDLHAVDENLRRMLSPFDLDPQGVCAVWQVHGADTVLCLAPPVQRKWLNRADGMVTNQRGLTLLMRFADCAPILFYDPEHEAIGIAHAGWRGALKGAQVSVLETMRQAFGTRPEAVLAGIGACIGPDRYQVGEEVVAQVRASFGTDEGLIRRADDGTAYFDLWEANRRKLAEAGVRHIEVAGLCTATRTDEFFSHRAEKGKTGRFGALIAL